jgi:succinate dehydrogenase/fumarate reductase cytochrome b subunit
MEACFETCRATVAWWQWILLFVIVLPWIGHIFNGLMWSLKKVSNWVSKKFKIQINGK